MWKGEGRTKLWIIIFTKKGKGRQGRGMENGGGGLFCRSLAQTGGGREREMMGKGPFCWDVGWRRGHQLSQRLSFNSRPAALSSLRIAQQHQHHPPPQRQHKEKRESKEAK